MSADTLPDLAEILEHAPIDLDAILDEPEHVEIGHPWVISSMGEAEWAMRKLADAREFIDAEDVQAKEWHAKIDNAAAKNKARAQRTADFMGDRLARFMLEIRRDDPRRKSIALPSGAIKTRENPAKVVIDDEATYLAWVQRSGLVESLLNPPKVSSSALRAAAVIVESESGVVAMLAGEVIPGVRVEPAAVSCTLNPDDGREPF